MLFLPVVFTKDLSFSHVSHPFLFYTPYFARYDLARPHIFYEKVVFFRISSTLFQVHAVGRAAGAGREPRLLDLTWAPAGTDAESLPKVMTTRTSEKTRTGTYGVAWYRKNILPKRVALQQRGERKGNASQPARETDPSWHTSSSRHGGLWIHGSRLFYPGCGRWPLDL